LLAGETPSRKLKKEKDQRQKGRTESLQGFLSWRDFEEVITPETLCQ